MSLKGACAAHRANSRSNCWRFTGLVKIAFMPACRHSSRSCGKALWSIPPRAHRVTVLQPPRRARRRGTSVRPCRAFASPSKAPRTGGESSKAKRLSPRPWVNHGTRLVQYVAGQHAVQFVVIRNQNRVAAAGGSGLRGDGWRRVARLCFWQGQVDVNAVPKPGVLRGDKRPPSGSSSLVMVSPKPTPEFCACWRCRFDRRPQTPCFGAFIHAWARVDHTESNPRARRMSWWGDSGVGPMDTATWPC